MLRRPGSRDDGWTMTAADPTTVAHPVAPRLYRNVSGRLLGGVAGALADHLGLSRRLVRIAFVLLSIGSGLGVLLYGAFWIVLPTPPGAKPEGSVRSVAGYLVASVAAAGVLLFN